MKKPIVNYQSSWKELKVQIKDLVLDGKNIRLSIEHTTQDEIINDLFLNEEAMIILENIYQDGYFPDEPPVVLRENGNLVVLEGNRRVVALKAMESPGIAPGRFATRIKKLMSDRLPIQTVTVYVAPSRSNAMEYLAAKHTKTTRKPWSALRRAYFYYAQKEQGQTIEKLIQRYKGVDIPSYIKMYEMHNIASSLKNISEDTRRKVLNKGLFKITTLERLYSDKFVQDALGIVFDKVTGEANVPISQDFDRVYSRIVTDIASGIATSRKELSKEKDREKYLESVIFEILGTRKISKENKKSAALFKPGKVIKHSKSIISSNLESSFDSPGIYRVLWELQNLDYAKYPNATADLLRTFLEIVIKKYLEETKSLPVNPRGGYLYLKDVLTKIKSNLESEKNHRLVQVINEIERNKWYLDSINHNPDVFAVGDRVKEAWDQIYPLAKFVFDDYNKRKMSEVNK